MSAVLILGDVHLGRSSNIAKQTACSIVNSRVIDQINLLDWIYDQAIDRNIRHIVLTGDVFDDPKPHYNLIVLFMDWLNKCSDYNISVHIVAGNHDILRSGQIVTSPLDVISSSDIDNVSVYKNISTLKLDNSSITFVPFRDRRSFNTDSNAEAVELLAKQISDESLNFIKKHNKILIGHLALEGSIPVGHELDELSNELMMPLSSFKGYDQVIMGHVHKFQVMNKAPHISHIGSMDISDFGETDHIKYIAIVDLQKKESPIYVEIPTRNLQHITIALPENNDNINEFLLREISKSKNLSDSIVKISIILPSNASYSIDRGAIEKSLYNKGVFHVTRISEERTFTSLKNKINEVIDNNVTEISAVRTYATLIEDSIKEDFINTAMSVIKEFKENIK